MHFFGALSEKFLANVVSELLVDDQVLKVAGVVWKRFQ